MKPGGRFWPCRSFRATRKRRPKRRNAPKFVARSNSPPTQEETEVARLTRVLREAMERQAATSEVLSVISRSPSNLQPVFAKMLENAIRICERLPDCGRQCRSILLQDRRTEPPLCSPTCGRDKVAVTDPSGEKAPRYIIADRPMTEEEWAPQ